MRRKVLALMLTAVIQPLLNFAHAQDAAENGSQSASGNCAQGSNSTNSSQSAQTQQSGQQAQQANGHPSPDPPSLAELARLARAKKQSESAPRAKVVLDDDNMVRGSYAADTPAGAAGGPPESSRTAAPFSEFHGKVVLVDFWASWCGPCRSALPNLKRLQSIYAGEDFVLVSVSEDDDQATWKAFTSAHEMTWTQRFDSAGSLQKQFGVKGLPTYVLIGRDGNVVDKAVGEDPTQSIMERIGPELRKSLSARL